MSRSLFAGIGVAAVLIFAACSPDQSRRDPLAPGEVGLAKGGGGGSPLCSGNGATDIARDQQLLFLNAVDLDEMDDQFALIKSACPIVVTDTAELSALLNYFALMISNRTTGNALRLANHLFLVSQYALASGGLVRDSLVFGEDGAADVLTVTGSVGDDIVSFDKGARLLFAPDTKAIKDSIPDPDVTEPFGRRLFTFTPLSSEKCGDVTGLRLAPRGDGAPCYDVHGWPEAIGYTPPATITICMHKSVDENDGIVHERAGYGDEVLPPVSNSYSCVGFHGNTETSWLERNGGPLGRVLARAYNYLAPKTLNADDAGESGSLSFFSNVGVILNDIFRDNFDDAGAFNPNPANDSPDLADDGANWIYDAKKPGYIRIENALGDMTGTALILSQGQGACERCATFKLLGEIRSLDEVNNQNETDYETNGSFDVIWTSLQNKPNIKEAPFILLNGAGGSEEDREIVRLSYVSVSNANQLLLKIPGSTPLVVGTWQQNKKQTFKITLNLNVLDDDLDNTVSLAIFNPDPLVNAFVPVDNAQNIEASRAEFGFKHIGYILKGIDAGIIGSQNWRVTRLPDIPPE